MIRRLNWRRHLAAWALAQLGRPFAWGACDCACLARGALEAECGGPIGADVPPYGDAEGAKLTWDAVGGLRGYLGERLDAQVLPGHLARPGDILVAPSEGFETALVFVDAALLGVEPAGVVRWFPFAPVAPHATAYRVG